MPAPETVPLLNAPHQRSDAILSSNYGPAQSAFASHLDVDEGNRIDSEVVHVGVRLSAPSLQSELSSTSSVPAKAATPSL